MTAPVFVKIHKYHEVLSTIEGLMNKLGDARGALSRIHQLKDEENKEVDSWSKELSDIESRIVAIKAALSKPEQT